MINEKNIEEYIVLYLDNELNENEKENFHEFIKQHPHWENELESYASVYLNADEKKYPLPDFTKKETLSFSYKKFIPYAAAILFLALSIPFLYSFLNRVEEIKLVKNEKVKKQTQAKTIVQNDTIKIADINTDTKVEEKTTQNLGAHKIAQKTINAALKAKEINPMPKKQFIEFEENVSPPSSVGDVIKIVENAPFPKSETEKVLIQEKPKVQHETIIAEDDNQSNNNLDDKGLALLQIDENHNTKLYNSINKIANKIDEKIKTIKSLKNQDYVLSIGNRDILTINN